MKKKLSIVLSNYNEKANLNRGVLDEMKNFLKKANFTWEVIINDDGSTDGGDLIISEFVKKNEGFKMIKGNHAGKAAGIWNGIQKAEGEVVLFTDMDQSTPLKEVEKLLPWFDKNYQVVFGSRGKMRKKFPLTRQITSWGFRFVRGIFLLRDVVDTQCGFKALKTDVAKQIFPMLEIIKNPKSAKSGWTVSAFDVELLFLAEKNNYNLKEVDVLWADEDTSTGKGKNFITESTDMLKQILRVKLNDLEGKYDKS
jgi:glycosyltransferase involved in cell wall biosynthesis